MRVGLLKIQSYDFHALSSSEPKPREKVDPILFACDRGPLFVGKAWFTSRPEKQVRVLDSQPGDA